jgi:hypothetical protein
MKTRAEIVAHAHRLLGILAGDTAMTADEQAVGLDVLDGILAEIQIAYAPDWLQDQMPDAVFLPLAKALAADLAPVYERPAPVPRARALASVMEYLRPDTRTDDPDPVYY